MSYIIINLSLPVVLQEIDNILEEYPEYPYQVTFAVEEFRQKLIAHVLNNIRNHFTVMDDSQPSAKDKKCWHYSIKECLHIENLIHRGIIQILGENVDLVGFMVTKKNYSLN